MDYKEKAEAMTIILGGRTFSSESEAHQFSVDMIARALQEAAQAAEAKVAEMAGKMKKAHAECCPARLGDCSIFNAALSRLTDAPENLTMAANENHICSTGTGDENGVCQTCGISLFAPEGKPCVECGGRPKVWNVEMERYEPCPLCCPPSPGKGE